AMVGITFADVTTPGTCPQEYSVTRTWTATDDCGNSSSCSRTIVVEDNTAPVINCPVDLVLECGDNTDVVNVINAWIENVTATDACSDLVTLTDDYDNSIPALSCDLSEGLVITFTATDECGNIATCSATVFIDDIIAPVIACPEDLILDCFSDTNLVTQINLWIETTTAEDGCDINVVITDDYDGTSIPDFSCEEGMIITFTATDDCGNSSTCTRVVYKPCIDLDVHVYLEGAAVHPSGLNSYTLPMRTTLNNLRLLPGQSILDPFLGIKYTQPGQPYCMAPWNYCGNEGDGFDSDSMPGNGAANYPSTVVDWVLVSLRDHANDLLSTVDCQAAALLHRDGRIELVQNLNCCEIVEDENYYVVVEHRNHLIVMSDTMARFVNHALTYDFRDQQSYIDDPFMFGAFVGQKQIITGSYAMYAGNGNQTTSGASDTDINADDRSFWEGQNGELGEYNRGDYNLNGDVNLNDRIVWERNNGRFTSVPRN
ncbi:MAG: hypothetical protein ABIQ11_01050, partial [Saprospiraceae bacterium]